ncbi:MAG: class I SAM-dependent methyltransferase [Propylenella sp.]
MAQPSKFWDKVAEKYSRQPVADEASYQKKLRITREYFRPDMEVLEFGCGTGSTAIAHAPYVKHILAIDVSSKMIEIARRKAEAAKVENVTFRQADIDELSVPDQTFDVVMGHSILHLVADRDAVISEVYRVLKPGGIFVTSTACLGDTQNYLKRADCAPGSIRTFRAQVFHRAGTRGEHDRRGFRDRPSVAAGKGQGGFCRCEEGGSGRLILQQSAAGAFGRYRANALKGLSRMSLSIVARSTPLAASFGKKTSLR